MPELEEALTQIHSRLSRYQGEGINEQNTKAALIDPLLRALGWDVEDLEEVHREYRHRPADNPVDYALLDLRTPRLFVEAKALGHDLGERRWANQIMGYASVAGVDWVVLTDGNEYRIYNAHARVPVEEKLFRTIRLTNDDPQIAETLELLSKAGLQENRLEAHWQAHFVDRQVQAVLKGLFAPEPDRSLVNLIRRRISDLSRRDIEESLRRVRARFDFPVEPVGEIQQPAVSKDPAPRPPHPPKVPGVSTTDLITAGLIQPPLDLHKNYLGQALSARIESDGSVTFQGTTYRSLSMAGSAARVAAGYSGRSGAPATNGWTFWQFTDADGQSKSIDVPRHLYLASHEPDAS